MSGLISTPPYSESQTVTEIIHGVPVADPYRWLEEQDSARTRDWIKQQTRYARSYLDNLPGRARIRNRIREFLAVQTYDSVQRVGGRYFFRKRLPDQEQPCIYMRDGEEGEDELLLDPADRKTGSSTAVKPLLVSFDGRLLLYEVKEGGERTGTFECLDIRNRKTLPDILSRGYLRGFAFAPDSTGFYYVHESLNAEEALLSGRDRRLLGRHTARTGKYSVPERAKRLRASVSHQTARVSVSLWTGFWKKLTPISISNHLTPRRSLEVVVANADYSFVPRLIPDRLLAITDRDAPNLRIVELRLATNMQPEWVDVVPESDSRINEWLVVGERIFVSYIQGTKTQIAMFDFTGKKTGEMPIRDGETVRLIGGSRKR